MTKKYYINVKSQKVEVSKEVYDAYHQGRERLRYLVLQDKENGIIHYDAYDTEETTGISTLADPNAVSVIDEMIRKEIIAELNRCLELLSKDELELIRGIFYLGMSEREYAVKTGYSQKGINKKKARILKKLKKIIEI